MYAELSFLERVRFPRDTEVYGKLWVGRIPAEGDGLFLKIITCLNPPCVCNSECYYYTVRTVKSFFISNCPLPMTAELLLLVIGISKLV